MYHLIKWLLLAVIRGPAGPPEPPAGSVESVRVFRASSNFLLYNLVVLGIVLGLLLLITTGIAIGVSLDRQTPREGKIAIWLLPAGLAFLGFVAYFFIRLEYDLRYYIVTDRSLRIREGVWTITEVTITFANVQHLEIQQGPIQQMLGISDVIVRTAGGGGGPVTPEQMGQAMRGHHGTLRGVDNAGEIRDQINALLKRYRQAGLGDPEEWRHKRGDGHWSPLALARLREIRDELRMLRQSASVRPAP